MKLTSWPAMAIVCCSFSPPVQAQFFSGTVSGTITAPEGRANQYIAMGFGAAPQGARVAFPAGPGLRNALVRVRIQEIGWTREYFVRTGTNGTYSVPWNHALPPISIMVSVFAERPNTTAIVTSNPSHLHRITSAGQADIVLGSSPTFGGQTGAVLINVALGGSEFVDAHRTADEVYRTMSAEGVTAVIDLSGLNIFANTNPLPGLNAFGGVAPSPNDVLIGPGTATARPFTLAHEIGHTIAWRGFEVLLPVIQAIDYGCDGVVVPAWADFSNECERAAFNEGFAHFIGSLWLWSESAGPVATDGPGEPGFTRGPGTFISIETNTENVVVPGGGPSCGAGVPGHQRAVCNARALWDIADSVGTDDTIARSVGDIVQVLRDCPNLCFDNRCVDEVDSNGVNWRDYRFHHQARFPGDVGGLFAIQTIHDLGGSDVN